MLGFLALTAAVYALVGQATEALTLLAAIVPLAGMDAFLHRRTHASAEGLRARLAARATVVRDAITLDVAAAELVVGDLVVVTAGEPLPADGVIVSGDGLQADEAILTGEAYAVGKRPLAVLGGGDEPLVDTVHWIFAGTRLLTGTARARIVYTGAETLYGEIVRSATATDRARTPLQQAIARLVGVLVGLAALVCVLLAVARLSQGHGWLDALVSAVTLASAALPEEFPVVFTFFLGVGAWRLAKRHALVRRAVSVENIGRVSAICTDKTGTLTAGRLDLTHLVVAKDVDDVRLLALARLASRPETGDPLDVAIGREAEAAGAVAVGRIVRTFPFTEARRRETVIARDHENGATAVTKGAAETVLPMTTLDAAARGDWRRQVDLLSAEGHRVIACAWRPLDRDATDDVETGYTLAGLLAFEDPVRDGVVDAIAACRSAGIHVVMVTGDHPRTAAAVAREIGLGRGVPRVMTGDELERHTDVRWDEVDVIARAAPAQKLTLVRALQRAGETVAVTGDGVNDVPALQAADVGIAMGERGTRSAREVSAIVLLDDNFRTIVGAIAEGRQLFRNLSASFEYLLTIHLPLVAAAMLVPLAGFPLLYLPVHIVWLELLLHPTALLAFQQRADATLERTGPSARVRFFTRAHWIAIGGIGSVLTVLVVAGYLRSLAESGDPAHGRAMALATMSLASAALAAALSALATPAARVIVAASIALPVLLIETPALARLLHVAPLHADDWMLAIVIAVGTFAIRRVLARAARVTA